jgi:Transposase
VAALVGAGYQVYAVNPMSSSRYRDRHSVSGAKSDPGVAKVLADMVRTDRLNHRVIVGDSVGVEAVKILARAIEPGVVPGTPRQRVALHAGEFCPARWPISTT